MSFCRGLLGKGQMILVVLYRKAGIGGTIFVVTPHVVPEFCQFQILFRLHTVLGSKFIQLPMIPEQAVKFYKSLFRQRVSGDNILFARSHVTADQIGSFHRCRQHLFLTGGKILTDCCFNQTTMVIKIVLMNDVPVDTPAFLRIVLDCHGTKESILLGSGTNKIHQAVQHFIQFRIILRTQEIKSTPHGFHYQAIRKRRANVFFSILGCHRGKILHVPNFLKFPERIGQHHISDIMQIRCPKSIFYDGFSIFRTGP